MVSERYTREADRRHLVSSAELAVSSLRVPVLVHAVPRRLVTPTLLGLSAKKALEKRTLKPLVTTALKSVLAAPVRIVASAVGQAKFSPSSAGVYLLTAPLPAPAKLLLRAAFSLGKSLGR